MVPTKRAAGDEAAPPPRRLRVTAAAPGSNPEQPPPSPRKHFLAIVLVVLFFKRPKATVSLSRIARLEKELGRLRHGLVQVRDTLGTLLREHEHIKKLIRALSSKLDNITGSSPNHHNHEHLTRQGTNQEGTKAEGSAETETRGKDTSIRLRFCSKLEPPVYHDDEIKSISIGIYDGDRIIESGLLSKLKIELLALEGSFPYDARGSWTSKEFHKHIAYGRDGKGNVLAGRGTNAQLTDGKCCLGSIRFREGSCRARNGMFIIGARVCSGQASCGRVQEAVMNPVVVQDRRNKYNEKNHPPNLDDPVYRLEKISINGEYRKRLEKDNICTVEHFLKALYKNEDGLAGVLQIKKKSKDWEKMVHHAKECCLKCKPELKSYRCGEQNVVLFFDYVHCLKGAIFGCRYIACKNFDPAQKILVDKLKKDAYDQLDSLTGDHVMMENGTEPICLSTGAGAGPSFMKSATQQKNSGQNIVAPQVGVTPASEVASPRAPPEPLRENANNAHGPNSFPDPNSTHNYQACTAKILQNVLPIGGIPSAEGSSHGLNESAFVIGNEDPSPSFSFPDHLTQDYQDQGTGLASQEQHLAALSGICLDPQDAENYDFSFLLHQAETNNWGAQGSHQGELQQQLVGWPGHGTLEASASAHIYMASTSQLLSNTGAPASGQGSMQQASFPNDGTSGRPPHQWPQCQGNMPGNTSF